MNVKLFLTAEVIILPAALFLAVLRSLPGPVFFPIRALVLGPDFNEVVRLAKESAARIRRIDGLTDVDTSVSVNSPELEVKIDRQRASDLGVRAADVGRAVRLMIAGEDQVSTYKEGDEQYDVTLQLLPEQQKNPEVLARLDPFNHADCIGGRGGQPPLNCLFAFGNLACDGRHMAWAGDCPAKRAAPDEREGHLAFNCRVATADLCASHRWDPTCDGFAPGRR